jgi:hypothetical protein
MRLLFQRGPSHDVILADWGVSHLHGPGTAVFVGIADLRPDDCVVVPRRDGTTAVFRVTRVTQVPKHAFPTEHVYGYTDHAALRLITVARPTATAQERTGAVI